MKNSYPSVQSFYKREVQAEKEPAADAAQVKVGDGFTEEELSDALDPLSRKWDPEREYEELNIVQLIPGPRAVTFVGRIVNLATFFGHTPKQPRAAGFHSLIAKDDSGAISIKLYFARDQYPLRIGQLLSLWTLFISDTSKIGSSIVSAVSVCANMFPGRVTSDHIMIHTTGSTDGICRTPLEYKKGHPLPGLMTLDTWLKGGHDGVTGAKILVCVKSLGGRKTIKRKDGAESDLADVGLFDHTGEVRMTLWNSQIDSCKDWQPGSTILLLSNPGYKVQFSGKGSVGITHQTMIDVEPDFPDADWLRKYAAGLMKKESLNVAWPEGVWDVEAAEYGVVRMLFTLAELDRWVRSDGNQTFTGMINVTIMEMSLVSLHRRNMLMCAECCGVPIYSNSLSTPCRNCSKPQELSLNPRIIGTLLDETGSIAPGKLLWSTRAWEMLFGRSVAEVTRMTGEEVRLFEQRVCWLRCHLVVGWSVEVGRLGVLGVLM
ncbi:hypothetical protein ONS95_003255 [Cadophora gregata]|uniref:uncharacterized protein n=1 Tax=Cadophora gregata TaxID=51156 RepID=UPI0026DBCC90|nr:uncharacterized protein ONS95_003255 [Cadophora gregata]KAK0108453.1 hypothetical protein ONS95_003255 [Cadophora gregata]